MAVTPTIFVSRDIGVHHTANLPEFVLQVLPGGLEAQIGDEAALPVYQARQIQHESQEVQELLADRNGYAESKATLQTKDSCGTVYASSL